MAGLALVGPLTTHMLATVGGAQAAGRELSTPSKRGGGGHFKALWWNAPNLLNPLLAVGLKDRNASAVFYEKLVAFNPAGDMVPVLAQEVPSVQNGGVAKDGTAVTWKLKRGVEWHDGKPFTASDVVFNWEYTADPATGSADLGVYRNVKQVEALDSHTVKIVFTQPTPYWLVTSYIIPRHIFEPYRGARSRSAPNNLQAGWDRAVPLRRFQARGSAEGRNQSCLPRRQSSVLRYGGGQGRRQRGFRGARRVADRRV